MKFFRVFDKLHRFVGFALPGIRKSMVNAGPASDQVQKRALCSEERVIPNPPPSRIEIRGCVEVVFHQLSVPQLRVSVEGADQLDWVRTEIEGDLLIVDVVSLPSSGVLRKSSNMHNLREGYCSVQKTGRVIVGIAVPLLKEVMISGPAKLELVGVNLAELALSVSGYASIEANGACGELKANVSGAGFLNCKELVAPVVRCLVDGAGTAITTATYESQVTVTGSGLVTVFGDPPERDVKKLGSGTVKFVR